MNMHTPTIDLSKPSVKAAYELARQFACNAARADGGEIPTREHRSQAAAMMARLLFHVSVEDGGFLGADEWRVHAIRERFRITPEQYADALHCAGSWPVAAKVAA